MEKTLTAAARVRRRFTAGRPRALQDRIVGPMEAMNKTVELLEKLRALTQEEGLPPSSVGAALIYRQPDTPGQEYIRARMVALDEPNQLATFIDKVMALDKPLFLGIVFAQQDREADERGKSRYVTFAWPFPAGAKDEGELIGMRERIGLLLARGDALGSVDN